MSCEPQFFFISLETGFRGILAKTRNNHLFPFPRKVVPGSGGFTIWRKGRTPRAPRTEGAPRFNLRDHTDTSAKISPFFSKNQSPKTSKIRKISLKISSKTGKSGFLISKTGKPRFLILISISTVDINCLNLLSVFIVVFKCVFILFRIYWDYFLL